MKKIGILVMGLAVVSGFLFSQELNDLNEKMRELGINPPLEELEAIDFELANLQGVKEKLSDYKGQVVFLNFWATWCGPCREEMPSMENLYRELKDEGFVILAVDLGEEKAVVRDFVEEYGLTFPVVLDEDRKAGRAYGIQSIPTTYIVDRQGFILGRSLGARHWDREEYTALFREILKM